MPGVGRTDCCGREADGVAVLLTLVVDTVVRHRLPQRHAATLEVLAR